MKPNEKLCSECPWFTRELIDKKPTCEFIDGDPQWLSQLTQCPDNRLSPHETEAEQAKAESK